jgi:hypothetical protein
MLVNRHIMVINTSLEFLHAMHAVLTIEEYIVTTCLLEEIFAQPLLTRPPDLLLVDYHPGLEEFSSTVYQWLWQQEMTTNIPSSLPPPVLSLLDQVSHPG